MRIYTNTFRFLDKVLTHVYTLLNSNSFATWGSRSRLGLGGIFVGLELIQVGSDVIIGKQAWLNAKDDRGDGKPTLVIGDGTYIGRLVHINAWRNVVIGRNVLIADRVCITDADHNFTDTSIPIRLQGDSFVAGVNVQDGSWIGVGATLLPGVTIGRNSVVAANSVVTKDVPDFAVVAGVPARIIRQL